MVHDLFAYSRLYTVTFACSAVLTLASCAQRPGEDPRADPRDPAQVALGEGIYAKHCASCHGVNLEGQPGWRQRLPNGRLPAPPHDASGHTWHHPDDALFGMTKHGREPGRYAPPGYQSDMPAFAGVLTDAEILAVLAFIKSRWPPDIVSARAAMLRESARR